MTGKKRSVGTVNIGIMCSAECEGTIYFVDRAGSYGIVNINNSSLIYPRADYHDSSLAQLETANELRRYYWSLLNGYTVNQYKIFMNPEYSNQICINNLKTGRKVYVEIDRLIVDYAAIVTEKWREMTIAIDSEGKVYAWNSP